MVVVRRHAEHQHHLWLLRDLLPVWPPREWGIVQMSEEPHRLEYDGPVTNRILFGLLRRCRRGDWEAAQVLRDRALERDCYGRVAHAVVTTI